MISKYLVLFFADKKDLLFVSYDTQCTNLPYS